MYVKLCLRGIRRCAKDYWSYCLTIGLTAAFVYAFHLLITAKELRALSSDFDAAASFLLVISIIVACVTLGMVRYATRFILERRSRELAAYLLLGMKKKTVCRLFLAENAGVGLCALIGGVLLGSLLYQVLRAVILNVLEQTYSFAVNFSLPALLLTLLYFILSYLLALRKSSKRLKKIKIYDLMYAARQARTPLRHPLPRILIFVLSLALLIHGLHEIPAIYQSYDAGLTMMLVVVMLVSGIYGVHIGIPALLEALCRLPFVTLSQAHLFSLRQITSRAGASAAVTGTVSLLLTLSLFCFTVGFGSRFLYPVMQQYSYPYDVLLEVRVPRVDFAPALDSIDKDCTLESYLSYSLYDSGQSAVQERLGDTYYHRYYSHSGNDCCIGLSAYNRLRSLAGLSEACLPAGGYFIHSQFPEYWEPLSQISPPVRIAGREWKLAGLYREGLGQQYGNNGLGLLLILPDELVQTLPPVFSCLAANTKTSPSPNLARCLQAGSYQTWEGTWVSGPSVSLNICTGDGGDRMAYLTISFSAFYLGLVLLLICATVLSLQQTSGMAAQRKRFSLLNRLGVRESARNRLILKQLAVSFGLPAAVPLICNLFIFGLAIPPGYRELTAPAACWGLALTYLLFFLVYACYFIAAYLSFQREIREV